MQYIVPNRLEDLLPRYVKKTYLPEKRLNPKTADVFTKHDVDFFAGGVAEMSAYFTSERSSLPKNYLNKKELRAGYLLYFVMSNFLKTLFCLNGLKVSGRFSDRETVKIADVGCGPGTASLACAEFFRGKKQKVEITAIDQNTNALRDAKKLFAEFAGENASLRTVYAHLSQRGVRWALKEKFDIIIASNCFSELVDVSLQSRIVSEAARNHLTEKGVLIIIEPALRWTSRNLMKLRDELAPHHDILAPCMRSGPCPMLTAGPRDWCHMYLDWKRPDIIARLDALIGNRKDYIKFSYLILTNGAPAQNPGLHRWRVVSSPMPSNGKVELLLCNQTGLLRVTRLNKDGTETNSDFDRVQRGDVVSFAGQGRIEKNSQFKIITKEAITRYTHDTGF